MSNNDYLNCKILMTFQSFIINILTFLFYQRESFIYILIIIYFSLNTKLTYIIDYSGKKATLF